MRRLLLLGATALVASLGFSALPAHASATNFTASSYPASFSGVSWSQYFNTEAGRVECKTNFQSAAMSEPSETVTVTPTYSECKAFGFLSASVNMNGCDYVLHTFGTMDIECGAFNSIVITASTCEMQISSQTNLAWVSLSNGAGNIWIGPEVGHIVYTVTKDGFACPFNGTGTKLWAEYQSTVDMSVSAPGVSIDTG
jgi:hypothetical protein